MNNEMNNKINDAELNNVTGGDNGDTQVEIDNKIAIYKVGDVVEVYQTGVHWHTTRATITNVNTHGIYPLYTVKYADGTERKVQANDIESGGIAREASYTNGELVEERWVPLNRGH